MAPMPYADGYDVVRGDLGALKAAAGGFNIEASNNSCLSLPISLSGL